MTKPQTVNVRHKDGGRTKTIHVTGLELAKSRGFVAADTGDTPAVNRPAKKKTATKKKIAKATAASRTTKEK